jgi:cytochrome c oxidase subunit 2
LLLCNKICGASHYNMQIKIIVETQQEFEKWMNDQQTFAEFIQ